MIRDRLLCCAFALFLAVLLTSLPLFAQKITGDISGTVQDSTGAVVKDATITAKNIGTGETRSAKSSDAGFYRIVELPPGKYTVTVSVKGFKTATRAAEVAIALVTQSEFNVQSNPGVEFGVRGGSVINIGLKSGTNDLHGSAFWDRHTDAFDARNWFATKVTPFRLNQFGASGGFPIKKDKAFVFMSYQGFHLKDVFPALVDAPTPLEISDATSCVTTGVNPNDSGTTVTINGVVTPWTTCLNSGPGPGSDQIFGTGDDGMVNSIGKNILSFIPTSPTGKLNVAAPNSLDLNNFHVKFDYILVTSNA